jgi:hypothetical protein
MTAPAGTELKRNLQTIPAFTNNTAKVNMSLVISSEYFTAGSSGG